MKRPDCKNCKGSDPDFGCEPCLVKPVDEIEREKRIKEGWIPPEKAEIAIETLTKRCEYHCDKFHWVKCERVKEDSGCPEGRALFALGMTTKAIRLKRLHKL